MSPGVKSGAGRGLTDDLACTWTVVRDGGLENQERRPRVVGVGNDNVSRAAKARGLHITNGDGEGTRCDIAGGVGCRGLDYGIAKCEE